ncbi:MAG: hypothetical protein ACI93V_000554, partial [Alteromonadaceae bacterium]
FLIIKLTEKTKKSEPCQYINDSVLIFFKIINKTIRYDK